MQQKYEETDSHFSIHNHTIPCPIVPSLNSCMMNKHKTQIFSIDTTFHGLLFYKLGHLYVETKHGVLGRNETRPFFLLHRPRVQQNSVYGIDVRYE